MRRYNKRYKRMDWAKHLKVKLAANSISLGEVVAYPTEAVWGLGCDPLNPYAVEKLLSLKARAADKGVLLVAANIAQVEPFLQQITTQQRKTLLEPRSQAITWLVPDTTVAPPWIRGRFDTVALRITSHPVAAALCNLFEGPIVSTSANPAGRLPALNPLTVRRYFPKGLGAITPGTVGDSDKPSEIRDIVSGQIIRQG